ncbi:uncharacterized protein LOC142325053 isoform X3 [Lycorma delicatula]|uniref:uncharacterized protein LOC142325053 isoform X3 n=1 Tax=Lycorma delicatula TaxID=130591 RepID=UPI003F51A526
MNVPVNNTFTNEAVLLNKNIKLVTEQDNAAQMIWLLLPVTETNTSHEHVGAVAVHHLEYVKILKL